MIYMSEAELIVWSGEFTSKGGIRDISVVEKELILYDYYDNECTDGLMDAVVGDLLKTASCPLDYDDILEEVYQHNIDVVSEMAFLMTLDDVHQECMEVSEVSRDKLDDMVQNNMLMIEESMYYGYNADERSVVYDYCKRKGISYCVYEDNAYGYEEFESTVEQLIDNPVNNKLMFNFAQQLMFDELLIDNVKQIEQVSRYGDFYIYYGSEYCEKSAKQIDYRLECK